MSDLVWFKSSYSGNEGGQCVEVALEWRKSTYSGNEGGNCVEVAACPSVIHVRDSKDPDGPALAFDLEQWSSFLRFAVRHG
ncbi:DUF397 domain-containing protein [Streptantibioticus parmotrematis]|uniref:DUF397 domain-containing protein n=1 Tax=Streptantibioticus parmotrematis TaxID=2873249 RepID=UPI0033F10B33